MPEWDYVVPVLELHKKNSLWLNDFKNAEKMNSAESVYLSVNTLSMC